MSSYDVVVFGAWPQGLYLVEELKKTHNKKVCYIELPPQPLPPIGLFLETDEDRVFFESHGTLNKQDVGFTILTPEGNWSLQESQFLKSRVAKKPYDWLDCLSYNLMTPIFEYNNFKSSKSSLNLFSEYYSFDLSPRKKKNWHEQASWDWKVTHPHSKINWNTSSFFIDDEEIQTDHIIFLNDEDRDLPLFPLFKEPLLPEWRWKKFSFSGDLGIYNEMVPHHFVCINNLSLPWTHDNLLNVFQGKERWDVWLRLPARVLLEQEKTEMVHSLLHSLHNSFKGTSFKFIKSEGESFAVYGKEKQDHLRCLPPFFPLEIKSFLFKEIKDFPQADLVCQLKGEQKLLKKVLSL